MSGEFGDLNISRKSAKAVTDGLKATMDELGELGGFGSEVTSRQGAGFSSMSMTGLEAGDGALADSFEDFCERWDWGVRGLVGSASNLADKLGLAAGMVHEQDQYQAETWKVGLNALAGNPYASEDEVAEQSYDDILTLDAPETAAERQENFAEMKQDWKDTGRSLHTEGLGGAQSEFLYDQAGVSDEAREKELDDAFGPSPEERAQREQSRGEPGGEG